MEKKITIIIPCYNVEEYLDRCMQSVVEQTIGISCMQIILVDDASTDKTLDKMIGWQAKYPYQIQIIHNAHNRRQGTCRNMGLQRAVGEYVAFLDADDWIEPDMYEKLLNVAAIGECDVVNCDNSKDTSLRYWTTLREKYTGKIDRLILIDDETDRCRMIASNLLGTYVVTKLYRRSFIEENKLQFPQDVLYEDIYWMALLNCYAKKIGMVEERLYHYYMNPNSVSRIRNKETNRDISKVNRKLWEEYQHRNLLEGELKAALSYEMLCTYYLTAAKMIFLRYDEIPYDFFYEVQKDILEMIPDYATDKGMNAYINQYTKPFNILLLGLLDKKLTHADIDSAAKSMRMLARKEKDVLAEQEEYLTE